MWKPFLHAKSRELIYANLENFYTLENDLGEVETSWFFIANIYLKINLGNFQSDWPKNNNKIVTISRISYTHSLHGRCWRE